MRLLLFSRHADTLFFLTQVLSRLRSSLPQVGEDQGVDRCQRPGRRLHPLLGRLRAQAGRNGTWGAGRLPEGEQPHQACAQRGVLSCLVSLSFFLLLLLFLFLPPPHMCLSHFLQPRVCLKRTDVDISVATTGKCSFSWAIFLRSSFSPSILQLQFMFIACQRVFLQPRMLQSWITCELGVADRRLFCETLTWALLCIGIFNGSSSAFRSYSRQRKGLRVLISRWLDRRLIRAWDLALAVAPIVDDKYLTCLLEYLCERLRCAAVCSLDRN